MGLGSQVPNQWYPYQSLLVWWLGEVSSVICIVCRQFCTSITTLSLPRGRFNWALHRVCLLDKSIRRLVYNIVDMDWELNTLWLQFSLRFFKFRFGFIGIMQAILSINQANTFHSSPCCGKFSSTSVPKSFPPACTNVGGTKRVRRVLMLRLSR